MDKEYQTDYGTVKAAELIRVYGLWKKMIDKQVEKRNAFNQTEEGKQKNRSRAKDYYQRHKEEILAKRKAKYSATNTDHAEPSSQQTSEVPSH